MEFAGPFTVTRIMFQALDMHRDELRRMSHCWFLWSWWIKLAFLGCICQGILGTLPFQHEVHRGTPHKALYELNKKQKEFSNALKRDIKGWCSVGELGNFVTSEITRGH